MTPAIKTPTNLSLDSQQSVSGKISFSELVSLAKSQGFITYLQANDFLPDEANDSHQVQLLLELSECMGIDFVEGSDSTPRTIKEESSDRPNRHCHDN